jgi:aspartate racemase
MNDAARTPRSAGLVGVLGGMGPLATLDFLHKVLAATPARRDQDHVPMMVSSIPQVPDRTAAFRGEGESPLPALLACGERLAAAGVGLLVLPCNTAHLWFDELQAALGLPMLHLADAALAEAARRAPGARLGLLATDATLASGLYLNRPQPRALQWVLPTAVEMVEQVMPGIAAVKAGELARGRDALVQAAQALRRRGADALVLGCTELPLVLDEAGLGLPVIDATDALARAVVAWSLAQREAESTGALAA